MKKIVRYLDKKQILLLSCIVLALIIGLSNVEIFAQAAQQPTPTPATPLPNSPVGIPSLSFGVGTADTPKDFSVTLQILMSLTVLTLAPSILVMMTCFTRIIVVFHFLKQALGTQQQPPSQVLAGLALFLTLFVMTPVLDEANSKGLQPYLKEEITQEQAVENMLKPFRAFMLKHTREEDLALFIKLRNEAPPATVDDVSLFALVPAFTISELRMGFQIGFILFVPFLVIDMVISSILMSLGMMLLPPQLISLPVKILLFILVDGWNLIVSSLMDGIIK